MRLGERAHARFDRSAIVGCLHSPGQRAERQHHASEAAHDQ